MLYAWLEEEDEITASPMVRMRPPIVPEQPVPVVPEDGLRRLLAACAGKDDEARRDTAIVIFLLDTGARRAELADLQLADLDLDLDVALVLGKGRRERALPYGRKTACGWSAPPGGEPMPHPRPPTDTTTTDAAERARAWLAGRHRWNRDLVVVLLRHAPEADVARALDRLSAGELGRLARLLAQATDLHEIARRIVADLQQQLDANVGSIRRPR